MKRVLNGLLLIWSGCLLAQASAPPAGSAWNEITGEKMLALKLRGNAARGAEAFEVCQGCHKRGATGSASGAYPRLAGQHRTVLIEQIADIRAGKRTNPRMKPFVHEQDITPQDIADIAAYVQALPIEPNLGRGPGTRLARGKVLYERDCAICHGERGEGNAGKFFPLIAAQHYRYLLREMRFIRDGERGNAHPDMVRTIKSYADDDLEAVADYIAELPPPQ